MSNIVWNIQSVCGEKTEWEEIKYALSNIFDEIPPLFDSFILIFDPKFQPTCISPKKFKIPWEF